MEVQTKELKKALAIVKPAVASTDSVEQATAFAFTKNKVLAYNEEICIQHPIDLDLEGSVKAEELYKFISKAKETLDISIDKDTLLVKSGRAKSGFALEKEVLLPIIKIKGKWLDIDDTFLEAIQTAAQTTSKDAAMPMMQCVHICEDGYVEASDMWKLLHAKTEVPIKTTLLFGTAVREVVRLHPTKIATSKGWCHFKNEEGTTISCRVIDETFADSKDLLKGFKKGVKLSMPKDLLQVLDRAEIFSSSNEESDAVTFVIAKGKLTVSAKTETSWFKESMKIDTKDSMEFEIKPYLLKTILNKYPDCVYTKTRLLFEKDDWKYVVSLTI